MKSLDYSKDIQKRVFLNDKSFEHLVSTPKVCIVFPVYNPPADWWKHSFLYCQKLVQGEPFFQWSFHFVNDGSLCKNVFPTQNALYTEGYDLPIFFHSYPENQGKGFAIRHGLQQVDDEVDFFMHSDWDFPFGSDLILDALKQLQESDVVLADRGSEYLSHLPSFRQKLTQTQRTFNRHVLRLKATDTQAGFKAFNTKGKNIFLKTVINGFLFDTEFVRLSERKKLSISTLEVSCRPSLQFKNFRFKVLAKEVWNLARLIVQ